MHNGIIFRGVVAFLPPKRRHLVLTKALETHPGKNTNEALVRTIQWWPCITEHIQTFVSKCKNGQMNKPSTGKTVSTWLDAKERQGNGSTWTGVMLRTKAFS